jgi:hypothetical protein
MSLSWGDNMLTRKFNGVGIYHVDDMSSIISRSYHRYLNEKNMDLKEQVDNILNTDRLKDK